MITAAANVGNEYPGASIGYLTMSGVTNPGSNSELDQVKSELEIMLREKYTDYDRSRLKELPVLQAYSNYYKKFGKTYHVQLQLESVVFKQKSIPSVAALVETMFMAELKNLLLTAIHDLDKVEGSLSLQIASGQEYYIKMNGDEQQTKARDMYISDEQGILSSIIYGPDRRTQVTSATDRALYTVYGPPGVPPDLVSAHLEDIQNYVRIISPPAQSDALGVLVA